MGRERLMQKQRERMEARRKRLKEAAKKATTKSVKKAVTRDTSKDQSRKEIARLTGGKNPKTGDAAMKAISKFAGKQPAPKTSKPPATTTKPPTTKPDTPPTTKTRAGKGEYTISPENRKPGSRGSTRGKDGLPYQGEFPGTPEKKSKPKRLKRTGGSRARVKPRPKPSPPKKNDTKVITIGQKKVTVIYNGSRWVPKK